MGRKLRSKYDLIYPNVAQKVSMKQAEQKKRHDIHARNRPLVEGEDVNIRNYAPGNRISDGRILRRHQDQIRRRHSPETCLDVPDVTTPQAPVAPPGVVASHDPPDLSFESPPDTGSVSDTAIPDEVIPSDDSGQSQPEPDPPSVSANRYLSRVRRPPRYLQDFVPK